MAWLSGWSYRKAIVIAHTADGAQTNYSLKLLVGESSGATGEDVDCGAKVASDFDDLRFTTQSGAYIDEAHPNGECDYWIESLSGSTPNQLATVWIEVPSIAAHPDDTTIYMYYGNSGASAASNGANTFIVYDGFERTTGNSVATGSSWTVATGSCVISEDHAHNGTKCAKFVGGATRADINIAQTASTNTYAIRFWYWNEAATQNFQLVHGDGSTTLDWLIMIGGDAHVYYYDTANRATTADVINDSWQVAELNNIDFSGNTFDIYQNNALAKDNAPHYTGDLGCTNKVRFLGNLLTTTGNDVYIDDYIVRKYTTNEPTWSSFGAEESFYLNRLSPYVHILSH